MNGKNGALMKNKMIIAGFIVVCGFVVAAASFVWMERSKQQAAAERAAYMQLSPEAQLAVDMERVKKNIEKGVESSCEETWNILWSWAKKGNLETRNWLRFLSIPSGGPVIMVPYGKSDEVYAKYNRTLAVHSYGYQASNIPLMIKSYVGPIPKARRFIECMDKRLKDCVVIAVEDHLVPSFEDFASEVDARLASGEKVFCMNGGGH